MQVDAAKYLHLPPVEIPTHWVWKRLDEICHGVFDCPHSTPQLVPAGDYFVVRTQDILTGTFHFEMAGRVSEETYKERIQRAEPAFGDLLYSREGTYFGIAAEVPKGIKVCLGQRMMLIKPKPDIVNGRYLRYWLNSPIMSAHVYGFRDGSVAERLNLPTVRGLPIAVPPLPEQHAIARTLGSLDDKIELSRTMNATLEEMARAVFRQWFVDSEYTREYEVGSLGLFLRDVISGARPKGGARSQGVPSVGAENIIGLGQYDYSKEKYIPVDFFLGLREKEANVQAGDVLLYKDGVQIGRKTYFDCGFPHEVCAINEHVFILRSKYTFAQRYLFFWLDQEWMTREIVNLNSNSAQPGINKTGVCQLKILMPPPKIIQEFDTLVAPMMDRIFANCKESRTLAALRDTLLPKLMRGEVRVKP